MHLRLPFAQLPAALERLHPWLESLEPRAERAVAAVRARWLFRSFQAVGRNVAAYGGMTVRNEGTVTLADRPTSAGGILPGSLVCHPGPRLVTGSDCQFNYGFSLEAWESVQVGDRCMVASLVRIGDRDGHRTAPIVLEDEVWVAHGAIIMPGVRVGARSVVSAGSVVTQDVPPDSLAMGNPARSMSLELVAREPGP